MHQFGYFFLHVFIDIIIDSQFYENVEKIYCYILYKAKMHFAPNFWTLWWKNRPFNDVFLTEILKPHRFSTFCCILKEKSNIFKESVTICNQKVNLWMVFWVGNGYYDNFQFIDLSLLVRNILLSPISYLFDIKHLLSWSLSVWKLLLLKKMRFEQIAKVEVLQDDGYCVRCMADRIAVSRSTDPKQQKNGEIGSYSRRPRQRWIVTDIVDGDFWDFKLFGKEPYLLQLCLENWKTFMVP